MRTLSRYLLRLHVAPFVFALVALTALLLLNHLAKRFGDFVGKGLPWSVVAEFFGLAVPFIIAMTVPMAVLVAVLFAWSRLAESNEYTALLSCGVSPLRLAFPVALAGVAVSLASLAFADQVLPRSNHRLRMLMVDIQRKKPNFVLKEQVANEVMPGQLFLRAGRINAGADRLGDVTIYDLQTPERRRVIHADSGRLAYANGFSDLHLTLHDGVILEAVPAEPAEFRSTYFATHLIRVAGVGDTLERTLEDSYRTDRELSICEMDARMITVEHQARQARADRLVGLRNGLREAAGLAAPPGRDSLAQRRPLFYCRALNQLGDWLRPTPAGAQTPIPQTAQTPIPQAAQGARLNPNQIASLWQRGRAAERDAASYEVEVHKKFVLSTACLVFVLLGVPLALRFPRAGVGLVIGASLTVFTVYYVGLIVGEDLGDRLIVNPALAMWLPNLVFAAVGIEGLRRLARGAVHARGGDGWLRLRQLVRSRRT
jgi:lipopolysaccharide export system permease protein